MSDLNEIFGFLHRKADGCYLKHHALLKQGDQLGALIEITKCLSINEAAKELAQQLLLDGIPKNEIN